MVFASTIEVYGPQERSDPLGEDDAKEFTGTYSRNKWEIEQMLLGSGQSGMDAVALRMPMIFGPGFYHEKAVLGLFGALKAGLPLPVPAPRAPVSFVASTDVAAAMVLAATTPAAGKQAFNIAAYDYPCMIDFFHELVALAGSRSRVVVLPEGLVDRALRAAERRASQGQTKVLGGTPAELVGFIRTGGAYAIDRARAVLGYEPRHSCASAWLGAYRWFWSLPPAMRYQVVFRQHV
jgi:nucleoside-diphosphate-sugar epimerase